MRCELALDEIGEMTHGLHRFELGGLELDLELRLSGNDQVDVIEGVPFGYVRRGKSWAQLETFIVKDIAKDFCQLRVDVLLLHQEAINLKAL